MKQVLLVLAIVMLLAIVGAGVAEDNKPANLVPLPQVKEVVVFKNGFAYVRCEGETVPVDGKIIVSEIPDASLGAFWGASLTKNVALESITARQVDVPYTQTVSNIQDLIRLNANKTVTIVSSDAGTITGTLLGFQYLESSPDEKLENQDPNEFYRRRGYWPQNSPVAPAAGAKPSMEWVYIKADGKVLATRINAIKTISIDDKEIAVTETLTRQTKQLVLAFGGDAKALQQPINYTLFFIIKGIRWIPDYKIELTSFTEANLRMSATVLNEVLNIKDAPVRLMIGYPNFAFGDTVSPLTLRDARHALSSFFRPPINGPNQNYLSNAIMSQRADSDSISRAESLPSETSQAAEGGVAIEDMFGYDVKNLTIAKGNVVLLPVMESKNPVEHLYELDSWSLRPITRHGNIPREVLDRINMPDWDRVWHKLKIKNPNNAPLTTAPATIFEKGHPIAQDMIKYTPPKSETIMPITIAVDIPNDVKEIEAERKSNALNAMNRNWDLVTNKGSIVVTNKKGINVNLSAKVHVLGKVTDVSPDGKTEASPKGWEEFIQKLWQGRREHYYWDWWNYYGYYENINPISLITWDIPLKAGESATLTYTYSYYDYR